MADDKLDDSRLQDPDFRKLFDPSSILSSDWYQERIDSRLQYMKEFWERREVYLKEFLEKEGNIDTAKKLEFAERIEFCQKAIKVLDEPATRRELIGSLGREPRFKLPN